MDEWMERDAGLLTSAALQAFDALGRKVVILAPGAQCLRLGLTVDRHAGTPF